MERLKSSIGRHSFGYDIQCDHYVSTRSFRLDIDLRCDSNSSTNCTSIDKENTSAFVTVRKIPSHAYQGLRSAWIWGIRARQARRACNVVLPKGKTGRRCFHVWSSDTRCFKSNDLVASFWCMPLSIMPCLLLSFPSLDASIVMEPMHWHWRNVWYPSRIHLEGVVSTFGL